MKNGMVVESNGDKHWYNNNLLHRGDDLPAIEDSWIREWYWYGRMYRREYINNYIR